MRHAKQASLKVHTQHTFSKLYPFCFTKTSVDIQDGKQLFLADWSRQHVFTFRFDEDATGLQPEAAQE